MAVFSSASISTTSTSEAGDGLREGMPNAIKAASDRHDTVQAIGTVPSLSVISAKGEHAFYIMSVVGGKERFGDRFHILIVLHFFLSSG